MNDCHPCPAALLRRWRFATEPAAEPATQPAAASGGGASRWPVRRAIPALALLLLLSACGKTADAPGAGGAAAAGPGGGMPPPPTVGVMTVKLGPVGLRSELPGRLEAWRTAQVRARSAGIVLQREFVEGAPVKAGQVLFQLDAAPYQAAQASAQAQLARAEAGLAQAQAQQERNRPLADARAISAQEWLLTQTTAKQAVAEVALARSALLSATINLDYATVRAPIAGRVGRALVSEGALVGQGEPTPMALVQQTDPLYVNFSQSSGELLGLRRAFAEGKLKRAAGGDAAELRVVLEDGSDYPRPAKLLFADSSVDAGTGQISLRAALPNPDGLLLPGMFVRVRIVQATAEQGVRVPQQAVTRGGQGDSVLVLGPGNKPMPRPVKVGAALGSDWVVLQGLADGEQVVVDGFQRLRPNLAVTPVPWSPGAAAAAPAAMVGPVVGPASAASAASGTAAASR